MEATQQVIPIDSPTQAVLGQQSTGTPSPNRPLAIRAARNHTRGVRTFYVASESIPGTEYVAQFIRRAGMRRWFCDCADFKFRRLARKRHCKHLHELTVRAREAHGVSRLVA